MPAAAAERGPIRPDDPTRRRRRAETALAQADNSAFFGTSAARLVSSIPMVSLLGAGRGALRSCAVETVTGADVYLDWMG
jgi:hypothetical protein